MKNARTHKTEPSPQALHTGQEASGILSRMRAAARSIDNLQAQMDVEIAAIVEKYKNQMETFQVLFKGLEVDLIALMKANKAILFSAGDIVRLAEGSLIHEAVLRVTIPRNAIEACKENGWTDVIKVVESLDRNAVEQWPDAKLAAIGAQRKPKEEFKYDLKKEMVHDDARI